MPPDLCPWLGSKQDHELRRATPAAEHRCYSRRSPAEIEVGTRRKFCLVAEHRSCAYYRKPGSSTLPLLTEATEKPREAAANAVASPPRWVVVFLWMAAILVAAAVISSFAFIFWDRSSPPQAAAQDNPTLTPTSSPTPTQSPLLVEAVPSPTVGLREPAASPTPYPGGNNYNLSPGPGAAGWVISDESRGNHLGDSYLYAGVFGGATFHGMLQFDLSSVPRGATIYGAMLEISGLDARRLGGSGVWEIRVLEREIDSGWSRHTYQDIHNADIQWTLPPALGVEDLAVGQTNVFELSREQLRDLEGRLLDEHYTLSFRIDGPLVGQNSVFAWDSGFGPATQKRRPLLLLNVGASPETPIPTGSPPPTNTPTPSLTPTPSVTPTPTDTPEWVVIASTPTPENVVTAAAIAVLETAWATTTGTATATPEFVATPTPSYFVVTNTPTPMNRATATYQQAVATAHVILTGTPTPPPQPLITTTSTPRPTLTPAVVWFDLTTMTPTPTTTPQPTVPALPPILAGKILFLSDRSGETALYVLEPATGRLGLVTSLWPYDLVKRLEILSPDGQSFAHVQNDERRVPQVYIYSRKYASPRQVSFNTGMSYDPVWSPRGDQLAFVSTEGGNDDIYVVGTDGQGSVRLTSNQWEWDKHPSWSPDGKQIVFWSNRGSGRKQLWIMNADGSEQRVLLESDYNDWDPVWVK